VALVIVAWGFLVPRYGGAILSPWPVLVTEDFGRRVESGDFENKYLPLGARLLPAPLAEDAIAPPEVQIHSLESERGDIVVRLTAERPAEVVIRRYSFPGWRVEIDGERRPVEREPLNGEILVSLPAGAHTLRAHRVTRPLEWLYVLVSSTALLGSLWGVFSSRRRWLGWLPCVAAVLVTVGTGSCSEEGFRPPHRLASTLEADRLVEEPLESGWSLVHYPGESVDPDRAGRGFAATLNLGPGGLLREGAGVWAAQLELPPQTEVALQHAGRVSLLVDGAILTPGEGERETLDGLELLPLPGGEGERSSRRRLVVVVSGIDGGAFARLLVREKESGGRWRLLPSAWLKPAENRGYVELFGGLWERGEE
jgi:hypothetical protein